MNQAAHILIQMKQGGEAQRLRAIREAGDYALKYRFFPEAIPWLLKYLRQEKFPRLAREAAASLWKFNDPQMIPPLLNKAQKSRHMGVRRQTIRALGFLKARGAYPIFEAALKDPHVLIRKETIASLRRIYLNENGAFPKRILRKIKRKRFFLFERSAEVRSAAKQFFQTNGGYNEG